MSHLFLGARRPRRGLSLVALVGLVAVAVVVSACSGSGPAFDPSGPCLADGKAEGAYPDLEALVPSILDGRSPDRLDSGRNCSRANLGSLVDHGLAEVRFAGGLWERGAESGTTLAVFTGAGLDAERMGEFYEDGARTGRKTSDIAVSKPEFDGRAAFRIDLVNNGMLQTIVTIDGPEALTAGGGRAEDAVQVVLVSSAARDVGDEAAHERAVSDALDAWTR